MKLIIKTLIAEYIKMITEKTSMRDAFFDKIYELAKKDKNIIVISADMSAPSLDKYREELKSQYISAGIAEQNAILVSSGLALCNKKPLLYAIMPFVTTRIHEFIKIEIGIMNLPIVIVGIGAGYSYDDSGPTHHSVEDIAILRPIPNLEIYSPSDSVMAEKFAEEAVTIKSPKYIRLDRMILKMKYNENSDFSNGFIELKNGESTCIIATGAMVDCAIEISEEMLKKGKRIGVVDFFKLKPVPNKIIETLKKYKNIITLEEHFVTGGIGSIISELVTDNYLNLKLKRIGVDKYNYEYGGRKNIQEKMGLDKEKIIDIIQNL